MKYLTSLFMLIGCSAYSQQDTCLMMRWMDVYKISEVNRLTVNCDSCFYNVVFEFLNAQKQLLFFQSNDILDQSAKAYPVIQESKLKWNITIDRLSGLKNEFGEDLVISCGGGAACWSFASDTNYFIDPAVIQNLRIREEYLFDSLTMTFTWKVTGINAYSTYFEPQGKPLWVDYLKLKEFVKDRPRYFWMDFLENRQYTGVQYMQLNCERFEYGKMWR